MVKYTGIDKPLVIVILVMLLFGLIMVYSSTMILAKDKFDDSFFYLKKQLMWIGVGAAVFLAIVLLKYPVYLNRNFVLITMFMVTVGLVMVFFFGKINGSYRWIRLFGSSIQPSEFAKISVVMYLSLILGIEKNDVNDLKKMAVLLIPVGIIQILILREPDYGSFFLILTVTGIVLFIAGMKIRYFVTAFMFLVPFTYLIIKLNPNRLNRVLAFLEPEKYGKTFGFQALQSIYAVGSGGIFGQGLGKSTQKLFFLPYAYTDFIYAIIGEEVGMLGSVGLLVLFILFLLRGIRIAKDSGSRHAYLLVTGLSFMVAVQALVNISVTLGIFPTKGMPLPFISLGGSSMLASMIIAGIILNVSRHRKTVLIND